MFPHENIHVMLIVGTLRTLRQGKLQYGLILQRNHFVGSCMTYVGRSRLASTLLFLFIQKEYTCQNLQTLVFFEIFFHHANTVLVYFPVWIKSPCCLCL